MRPKGLLLGLLSHLVAFAQGNAFGTRLGFSLYQYRTAYAQFLARLGGELGAVGRIRLFHSHKNRLYHSLLAGFGYLMGHSRLLLDSSIYISPLTGRPLTGIARAHTYTHYLYMQTLWHLAFEAEGALAIGGGFQLLRALGQTLMLEYETPDGQPIQEWNAVSLSDLQRVLPLWIPNLTLYAELRLWQGRRSRVALYTQTIHQINRFLWPTGLLLGAAWLYTGNPDQ
ncbi:MAG: hypothetical protein NZ958_01015 [Bacteroidia bacterium]|nr:hypothetical protein [Bacteroidia bacterium]MDW8089243.1 hypothetical protein [Bacteroidia bacterium]